MKWQTHAELNIVTLREKKEAQNLVQRRKGTINILLSRIEMTSCHLNILSIIKKNKCLFFKPEHKYQAIINSSKLVVRDKPSRQTTKAHTISNRKGNKNISPRQYKSKQLESMCLCYAGLIQRAPKSRIHLRSTKPRTEGSGGRLFTSGFTFCLK